MGGADPGKCASNFHALSEGGSWGLRSLATVPLIPLPLMTDRAGGVRVLANVAQNPTQLMRDAEGWCRFRQMWLRFRRPSTAHASATLLFAITSPAASGRWCLLQVPPLLPPPWSALWCLLSVMVAALACRRRGSRRLHVMMTSNYVVATLYARWRRSTCCEVIVYCDDALLHECGFVVLAEEVCAL